MIVVGHEDLDFPTRTVWAEAEGEPEAGRIAVAWAIRNRAEHPSGRYGRTLAEVVRKPKQFSCWNDGNPRLAKLHALRIGDPGYLGCMWIVVGVALGLLADPTGGCTHYHAADLALRPLWARNRLPHIRIGDHIFYRGVDP